MKPGIEAYQKHQQARRKDELVRKHAALVRKVGYRLIHRLPASVELEDLISAGSIGLLHAIDHYDPAKGVKFESFAEFRIKGAMLDELRSYDFMSRTARGKANKIDHAQRELANTLGRPPTIDELAEETGIKTVDVEKILAEAGQVAFLTMDDLGALAADQTEVPWELLSGSAPEDPFGHTFFRELRKELVEALEALPERLKMVMSLYYYNDLNFKEIGRVLDLTESRISQLHSEAVKFLRRRLAKAL